MFDGTMSLYMLPARTLGLIRLALRACCRMRQEKDFLAYAPRSLIETKLRTCGLA